MGAKCTTVAPKDTQYVSIHMVSVTTSFPPPPDQGFLNGRRRAICMQFNGTLILSGVLGFMTSLYTKSIIKGAIVSIISLSLLTFVLLLCTLSKTELEEDTPHDSDASSR